MKINIESVSSVIRELIAGLIPYRCPGCGVDGYELICSECLKQIVEIGEPYCKTCGRLLPPGVTITDRCSKCDTALFHFKACRSALVYDIPVSGIVKDFKFNRKKIQLGNFLGRRVAQFIENNPEMFSMYREADFLVPVPLHTLRFYWRGFNQSELLARYAAGALGVKIGSALVRTRNTKPQSRLNIEQRELNVKNAFAVKKGADVSNKRIILMDDVMTTGATVNECSRILRAAGAKEILVLTAARRT